MPIQVYGVAMSTCTQRVLTTLIEKGLKYELVVVDIMNGEQKVKIKFKKYLCSMQFLHRLQNISKKNNHLALFLY